METSNVVCNRITTTTRFQRFRMQTVIAKPQWGTDNDANPLLPVSANSRFGMKRFPERPGLPAPGCIASEPRFTRCQPTLARPLVAGDRRGPGRTITGNRTCSRRTGNRWLNKPAFRPIGRPGLLDACGNSGAGNRCDLGEPGLHPGRFPTPPRFLRHPTGGLAAIRLRQRLIVARFPPQTRSS